MNEISSGNSRLIAIVIGIAGGIALIASFILSKNGFMCLIPYAAMSVATVAYLRGRPTTFSERFNTAMIAWVLANVIGLIYVDLTVKHAHARSLWMIVLPIGAMLLIGLAVSALIAAATRPRGVA
jgi:hypothetical protein